MSQEKYSIQKSEQITTGYFKIYKDTYKYYQKEDRVSHVLKTSDVALVFALDKDKQVILVNIMYISVIKLKKYKINS
ncbi:MAG: hypothetical protein AAGF07_03900 [Patescibacteria group bacterium]